jgi:hypothetical protein
MTRGNRYREESPMNHLFPRWTRAALAVAAGMLSIGAAQAAALKMIDYAPPGIAAAAAENGPDLNGDGLPDYFEIRNEVAEAGLADRLHDDSAQAVSDKQAGAAQQTCVYVAINEGDQHWSHDRAYCGSWKVTELDVPDRVTPKDQLPYVAHLSKQFLIPKFGYVASARDAVYLAANGKPSFLFFDGVDYVLHTGMDAHKVVSLESMEMLARFETGHGGAQASAVSAP